MIFFYKKSFRDEITPSPPGGTCEVNSAQMLNNLNELSSAIRGNNMLATRAFLLIGASNKITTQPLTFKYRFLFGLYNPREMMKCSLKLKIGFCR